MNKLPFFLALALVLAACSGMDEFYGKEYVLYDGRKKAEEQELEEPEPQPQPAHGAASAPAGVAAAAQPTAEQKAAVARIFVLESVLDELNRAIRAGQGDGLIEKRNEVEKELAWRKREAGGFYDKAWEHRLAELRDFPTQVAPEPDK